VLTVELELTALRPRCRVRQSNLPKLITQVTFTYGKILGKAFMQAGRQAYKSEYLALLVRELGRSVGEEESAKVTSDSSSSYRNYTGRAALS
jgi:hypothetical protein